MNAPHTALRCLVAVARHHGLDLSVERLAHEHSLGEAEPDGERLLRIAREAGLEAKLLALDWESLRAQPQGAFPMLLRLKNGNTVVALGFKADTGEVVVSDPLADRPGHLMLSKETLEGAWNGEALVTRRVYRLDDENQPFGLRWFIPEILRQKNLFRDVAIAAVLLHLIGLGLPIFFQLVIDRVLVHQTYSTLYVLCIGIVIALSFEAIFGFLRQYLVLYATTKIDVRLAVRVFAHLVSLPVAFFEQHVSGVLLQHVQQQRRIREFLTGRLFVTLLDATVLLIFLPVLLLYSVKLTLIMLAFCAAIAAIMLGLIGPFRERLLKLYQAEASRQGLLVESIHGMSTVKSLALEPRQRRAWEERVAASAEMQFRVGKISAIAQTGTHLLEKMMLVAIIAFGAADVFSGAMSVGALVAFQMLSGRVSGPLVQMVSLIHEFQETSLAVRMLGEVMNRAPEPGALSRGLRPQLRGQIEFDGVTFAYGAGPERALDRVSFRIPEGGIVGVVGRSGGGKTTIARLLQGLHQAQEGAVRIDGYNVRELDVAHLRRSVGIVPQDTFLFKGTVRDNIGIARPDATLEEVVEAARMAGADDFIDRLPKGIHTPLEEGGSNLSGGQRQRLAIARALLLRPRVLIFDEATSSLDPESEAIVQKNLAGIGSGRTLVVITHRLSNLVHADAILVMDRGRIVDHGPHAELAGRPGVYASLWRQQTRHMA